LRVIRSFGRAREVADDPSASRAAEDSDAAQADRATLATSFAD
jgi:hypothetical protein